MPLKMIAKKWPQKTLEDSGQTTNCHHLTNVVNGVGSGTQGEGQGWPMRYCAQELRSEREVVMKAVSEDGRALEHASLELRGDREIVMRAVTEHGFALKHAAKDLMGDREVVMAAVARHGDALRFATEELRDDREVVMAAVAKHGMALRNATAGLRGDRQVVMKAISQSGFSVLYATREMRGDEEVMQAALAAHPADLVGLRVFLLSGRSCNQIFYCRQDLGVVFRRCAELLDLDPEVVQRHGSLMFGSMQITDIIQLPMGKVHELTLLLT